MIYYIYILYLTRVGNYLIIYKHSVTFPINIDIISTLFGLILNNFPPFVNQITLINIQTPCITIYHKTAFFSQFYPVQPKILLIQIAYKYSVLPISLQYFKEQKQEKKFLEKTKFLRGNECDLY